MNYITTTNLRTQTSELIDTLGKMGKISLIHRSKIVGIIQPINPTGKTFNASLFQSYFKNLELSPTTLSQRETIYRSHLQKKYG